MPAFIAHGFMGYLLYGYEGLFYGLLPDIIGFGPFFYRILKDYSLDPKDSLIEKIHSDKTSSNSSSVSNPLSPIIINK